MLDVIISRLDPSTQKNTSTPKYNPKIITHPNEASEYIFVSPFQSNPHRRMTVFDYLCENDAKEDENTRNPYIHFFCTRLPALHQFHEQNLINWRSFFNKTSMKKEVTESGAIVYRVLDLLRGDLSYLVDDVRYKLVFFDCCSGKGFTSVMLGLLFPHERCSIWMLDKDLGMKIGHNNSLPNVHFEHFYIYPLHKGGKEKTLTIMNKMLKREQDKNPNHKVVGICLASHLCGNSCYIVLLY